MSMDEDCIVVGSLSARQLTRRYWSLGDSLVAEARNGTTCVSAVPNNAVEFCRGAPKRPVMVDLDGRVLCFDGPILDHQDFSPLSKLDKGGLFVVRSPGDDAYTAMRLANFLRERLATVVIYDYCLSTCAGYLLVASGETYVIGDTVIA